ncbi:MAG: Gfo/Idh/MocA family oxidoreductase, partial [Limisphaerales bacterium]
MKKLNIGMLGCGFMGRAHSNAFRKVNNFFDLEYQPVLKAVYSLHEEKAKAFAEKWVREVNLLGWLC